MVRRRAHEGVDTEQEEPDEAEKKKKSGGGEEAPAAEASAKKPASTAPVDAEKAARAKRRGDEAFVKGDFAAADEAYGESIDADTGNAKVWANRAAARLRLKDPHGALSDAQRARAIDPGYAKAWYREGCAYRDLKRWEDAACAMFEALQHDENNNEIKKEFNACIAAGRAEAGKGK